MIYTWTANCGHETEVIRPLKDIDLAPDKCAVEGCEHVPNKRIVKWSRYQSQLVFGGKVGFHNEEYTRLGRSIK